MNADFLEKPHKWDAGRIHGFMVVIDPISSLFDFATFALTYFFFEANSIEYQSMFQTDDFSKAYYHKP